MEGRKEVYYDRSVKSQADVNKKYGESSGVRHLADGTKVGNGQYTVYNDHKGNKNGVVKDVNGKTINPDRTIIYGKDYTLFAGVADESVNAESLHNNYFGSSYIGPDNPKDYNGKDNYDYQSTWRINYYEEISRKKNKVMKKKFEAEILDNLGVKWRHRRLWD